MSYPNLSSFRASLRWARESALYFVVREDTPWILPCTTFAIVAEVWCQGVGQASLGFRASCLSLAASGIINVPIILGWALITREDRMLISGLKRMLRLGVVAEGCDSRISEAGGGGAGTWSLSGQCWEWRRLADIVRPWMGKQKRTFCFPLFVWEKACCPPHAGF